MDAPSLASDAKSWSDVAANVAQVVAIAVGGWWAYTKFIRQREEWPRMTVEQVVSRKALDESHTLLRVAVKAKNDGTVLIPIEDVRVFVSQVVPLAEETRQGLEQGTLASDDSPEVSWPCIEARIADGEPAKSR